MSNPQRSHGLQPTRALCPWDSPGKSTGVGCHRLLLTAVNYTCNPKVKTIEKKMNILHLPPEKLEEDVGLEGLPFFKMGEIIETFSIMKLIQLSGKM